MENDKLKQFLEKIRKREEEKSVTTDIAFNKLCAEKSASERFAADDNAHKEIPHAGKTRGGHKYIHEDKSRRRANVRTYLKEKGKSETVITGVPVNYYNRAEKRYRQIDNTLEYRSGTLDGMNFSGYENRYNSFKARFAESTASSDLMRIEKDGYELYFKLLPYDFLIGKGMLYKRGHRDVHAAIGQGEYSSRISKIKYGNLYDGIDFDYEIRSDSIKENITIKSRGDNYIFAFKVLAKGLDASLSEDKREVRFIASVSQNDTSEGDTVFTMPSAFMCDKSNNKSENIIYSVEHINGDEFLLRVIPDSNWLKAEERTFPVVIDPNIIVKGDESDLVYKIVKNYENYSGSSSFYRVENGYTQIGYFVGNASEEDAAKLFGETELYIGFRHISRIREGIVNSAYIHIPIYLDPDVDHVDGYYEVYGITDGEDWYDREVNWNDRPNIGGDILALAKPICTGNNYFLDLSITTAMASKYSGFVIKASTLGNDYTGNRLNSIYIPNQPSEENLLMSVTYIEKDHVRGNKNIQHDCNQAGTGSIDLFTGDLSFVFDDLRLEGVQLPIQIAHVYNSRFYDENCASSYSCGAGWRLNFIQKLDEIREPMGDVNGDPDASYYEYIDGSGNRHELFTRYYKEVEKDGKKYKIYRNYDIEQEAEGEDTVDDKEDADEKTEVTDGTYVLDIVPYGDRNYYTLTDEQGNVMTFSMENGLLVSVKKYSGQTISISYISNESEKQIKLVDDKERNVTCEFSESNLLKEISCGGKKVEYEYKTIADKPRLSAVIGDFGRTTFEYDEDGRLCKVTDPSGYIIDYKLSSDQSTRYNGYKIKCSNKEIAYNEDEEQGATESVLEQLLDDISITYNAQFNAGTVNRFIGSFFLSGTENMTKVENIVGAAEFYLFDTNGTMLSNFDNKMNQQVNYVSAKNQTVDPEERWGSVTTTQISAKILNTAKRAIDGELSRTPINSVNQIRKVNEPLVQNKVLPIGGYVLTAIITGNIVSGKQFDDLSSETAQNTSYMVLKVVRHLVKKSENEQEEKEETDEQFVRVNPSVLTGSSDKLVCLPFIVDSSVVSVDFYAELNNMPYLITVACWDVMPAAQITEVVAIDKDVATITEYKGKYGTESTIDLSKRNEITETSEIKKITKQTTTQRIGTSKKITSVTTYDSENSENILEQDDGISLIRSYEYDNSGNVTLEKLQSKSDVGLIMKRAYVYEKSGSDVSGNALFEETDENGNTTRYSYQTETGLLSRTILPGSNQKIDYSYFGSQGLLKEVKALANSSQNVEETSNKFYYNLGYLTRVEHESCTYDFTYDGFGRIIKVDIGGRTIIRSAYVTGGADIDGVEGATSKTATAYYRTEDGEISTKETTDGMAYCNSIFCGQYYTAMQRSVGNQCVYVSYYNKHGELIKVRYADGSGVEDIPGPEADYITVTDECEYASAARVLTYIIGASRYVYNYERSTGELLSSTEYENDVPKIKYEVSGYDKFGRQTGVTFTLDKNDTLAYNYTYKSEYEDWLSAVTLPSGASSDTVTDDFGRLRTRKVTPSAEAGIDVAVFDSKYEYCGSKNESSCTTPLVEKETHNNSNTEVAAYLYTYDANNNILTIKNGSGALLVSYEYDGLNRLIRENIVGGNTTVFRYDKGGNLQYKKEYTYSAATGKTYTDLLNGTGKTISYGYGISSNKDLLTSYNGSGTLEYDNYGNPKKWFKHSANNSSLGYTLQWGHVSNLIAITDNDAGKRYTYKYNDQGIRTVKVVNGVVHKYYLQGEQIIAERYGGSLIKFYYDSTGVCGFRYYNKEKDGDNSNGTDYYYQKNIQGDILRIFDKNGNLKAEYSYDAWGKCTIKSNVSNIAAINPFRYRGYYFDSEIGLYYLNARYYDPEIGRFISPDNIAYLYPETINGLNIYAYCLNNPVMCTDPYGTTAWWEWLLLGLGLAVIIAAAVVATVATGGAALIAGGIAIGGAMLGLSNIVGQGLSSGWSNINIGQVGASMLLGGALGGFGLAMGGGISIGGSLALAGGGTVGVGAVSIEASVLIEVIYLFARIGKSNGYRVDHYYPNDHEPIHIHIRGDDIPNPHGIRVGLDGKPLPGEPKLPRGAKKAIIKLWEKIIAALAPWRGI